MNAARRFFHLSQCAQVHVCLCASFKISVEHKDKDSNACTTNSSNVSMYVRSVSDGHWMVHISADTSNTIVSEISVILSDMTTCRVFFRTDISVFFIRPFCSNIDEGYAASLVDNTAAMSMLCPLT